MYQDLSNTQLDLLLAHGLFASIDLICILDDFPQRL